jgi:hypothetical protein
MEATSRFKCSFFPPKKLPVSPSKTAQHFALTDPREFSLIIKKKKYINPLTALNSQAS